MENKFGNYQSVQEEVKKAEEMMTGGQKEASEEVMGEDHNLVKNVIHEIVNRDEEATIGVKRFGYWDAANEAGKIKNLIEEGKAEDYNEAEKIINEELKDKIKVIKKELANIKNLELNEDELRELAVFLDQGKIRFDGYLVSNAIKGSPAWMKERERPVHQSVLTDSEKKANLVKKLEMWTFTSSQGHSAGGVGFKVNEKFDEVEGIFVPRYLEKDGDLIAISEEEKDLAKKILAESLREEIWYTLGKDFEKKIFKSRGVLGSDKVYWAGRFVFGKRLGVEIPQSVEDSKW